jgi:hypothetical protein
MNATSNPLSISSTREHRIARITSLLCAALFVVALTFSAQAQSGRRQPKAENIPPVPTPTPEATPKPKTEPAKRIPLLVLADNVLSVETSSITQQLVSDSFMRRLHESDAFDIGSDSKSTSRASAIKRAKEEKERAVVWIALRAETSAGDPISAGNNPSNYHIEYAVYEPGTGKSLSSGFVYLRPVYGGIGGIGSGVPRCYPANYTSDYSFILGAIETANRVMSALSVAPPPLCSG